MGDRAKILEIVSDLNDLKESITKIQDRLFEIYDATPEKADTTDHLYSGLAFGHRLAGLNKPC